MTESFWNQMYQGASYRYGKAPNAFLVECRPRLREGGAVVCVGDGEGRNGVWLAEQGFRVTSVDASSVGVRKTRALAAERGVSLTAVRGLIPEHDLGEGVFDAAVLIYIHLPEQLRAKVHAAVVRSLEPGGTVILEAFTRDHVHRGCTGGGPGDPTKVYDAALLRRDFAALDIVLLEERETTLTEGEGHSGTAHVVRMIARRPA